MSSEEQEFFRLGLPILIGGICCVAAVGIAIQVFICWLLQSCFNRIPPEYRLQQPGMVWLLLIPLFSIVWNFFVYPKLAQSYQAYFAAQGRTDVGDAGYTIAMAMCICAACSCIPYIGVLPGFAALILLIIFLVKAVGLRDQIPGNNPGSDVTIR